MGRGRRRIERNPLQAERLNEIMREAGIKQAALAKIVGCKQQAISKYVNSVVGLPNDVAEKIGKEFNVRPAYLLGLDSWKRCEDIVVPEEERLKQVEKAWNSISNAEKVLCILGYELNPAESIATIKTAKMSESGQTEFFDDWDKDDPNAIIILKDKKEVGRCSLHTRSTVIDSISSVLDYAELQVLKLLDSSEKGSADNG